ncbi:MAG: hypothetical protein WBC21_04485 [Minisyncoccales bacterium]
MKNKQIKTINVIVPIFGLGSILNNVKLSSEIKIRFIDYVRKENELLQQSNLNHIKYSCVLDVNYRYDHQKADEPYPAIGFLLDKIQAAFRVFHPGIIGFAGIISKPKVSPFPFLIDLTIPSRTSSYKIDKNKLNIFPEFYKKFCIAYPKKQIAFDWFNKSYLEVPVNKVINYSIILENLFVPPKTREKKNFVLQGLTILKFSKEDKEKIDTLFQYRNAVVHADIKKQMEIGNIENKQHPHHLHYYEDCEKIIRKSLHLYVKNPW